MEADRHHEEQLILQEVNELEAAKNALHASQSFMALQLDGKTSSFETIVSEMKEELAFATAELADVRGELSDEQLTRLQEALGVKGQFKEQQDQHENRVHALETQGASAQDAVASLMEQIRWLMNQVNSKKHDVAAAELATELRLHLRLHLVLNQAHGLGLETEVA